MEGNIFRVPNRRLWERDGEYIFVLSGAHEREGLTPRIRHEGITFLFESDNGLTRVPSCSVFLSESARVATRLLSSVKGPCVTSLLPSPPSAVFIVVFHLSIPLTYRYLCWIHIHAICERKKTEKAP